MQRIILTTLILALLPTISFAKNVFSCSNNTCTCHSFKIKAVPEQHYLLGSASKAIKFRIRANVICNTISGQSAKMRAKISLLNTNAKNSPIAKGKPSIIVYQSHSNTKKLGEGHHAQTVAFDIRKKRLKNNKGERFSFIFHALIPAGQNHLTPGAQQIILPFRFTYLRVNNKAKKIVQLPTSNAKININTMKAASSLSISVSDMNFGTMEPDAVGGTVYGNISVSTGSSIKVYTSGSHPASACNTAGDPSLLVLQLARVGNTSPGKCMNFALARLDGAPFQKGIINAVRIPIVNGKAPFEAVIAPGQGVFPPGRYENRVSLNVTVSPP